MALRNMNVDLDRPHIKSYATEANLMKRINFPGGSSSGWSRRSHDETVEWRVVDDPEPAKPEPSKWGKAVPNSVKVSHVEPPVADVLVMGDGGKWGSAAPTPTPAPASVGKWGNGQPPKKDSWGRPI